MTRLTRRSRRAAQRAAKHEVLAAVRKQPIAAYGLYCLLDDAGLISSEDERELAPLIQSIEQRLHLPDEDHVIRLPLSFEPLTDIEYDTLTLVIAEALREFATDLQAIEEPRRYAELLGINNLLRRHLHHTASLHYEIHLHELLKPLLQHCGEKLPFYQANKTYNARPGDFFRFTKVNRSRSSFTQQFLDERALQKGDYVRLEEVWEKGYARARFLHQTATYSRSWLIPAVKRRIPQDGSITVVRASEGDVYRLPDKYDQAVTDLIELYRAHTLDLSPDPNTYQPTGPRDA